MLEIGVGREAETLLVLAGGIEAYEVAGYILELALCFLLQAAPCPGAEFVDGRLHPLLSAVLRELVQSVNRHKDAVVVLVDELYHLLCGAVDVSAQKAAETPHAMIGVHNEIAWLDGRQFLQREGEFA